MPVDDEQTAVAGPSAARCRLTVVGDGVRWTARAERDDTGERFGLEVTAATADAAVDQLRTWLEWQAEHAVALAALQDAQRAYHRAVADRAFAGPGSGPDGTRDSLEAVEQTRARLDAVRARRPQ